MPVAHWLEQEGRVVVVTAIGAVTAADGVAAARSVLADPGVRPGAVILVDATAADPAIRVDELWDTARGIAPLLARQIRHIVIATSSDFAYGLSRAFEVSAAALGFEVRSCRSLEDAWAWVGGR
jgi:hypothetical protein